MVIAPAPIQSPKVEAEPTKAGPLYARDYPEIEGKTTAEYAYDAMQMHREQYKGQGTPPPGLVKWFGDAALAVAPLNRISCAVGLTGGLLLAGNVAKVATGYSLDGKAVPKEDVPTFLSKLYKVVKNYDPKGLDERNRWIKYAQWATYSLGGLIGVKLGTDYAYRNVSTKNKDPHYFEDHLARISMHQGEAWGWLAAFSGMFGSASGLFALPVPGLNYGIGLAGRTTSMQDRNFMLKGMNEMLSGASTSSYLRLKEGTHYLAHYAAGNPAQTPNEIEYLAFTLLGPLFGDQLKPEHIQKFTEALHAVRDPYWQEGGIPKAKRNEAIDAIKDVFTGAGLEVLLIDMGLNPGTVAFDKLNGITGKIGNVTAGDKVRAEQAAYIASLQKRLPSYVADGELSQERADWVLAGIEAAKHGKPQPPLPDEEEKAAEPLPAVQEKTPWSAVKKTPTMGEKRAAKGVGKLIEGAFPEGDWAKRVHQPSDKQDVPLLE